MNKLDSELVAGILESEGFEQVSVPECADIVLFNTCSVREHAEDRFFSNLGEFRRAKQRRPELVIGVLGCTAERLAEDIIRRMPHVDFVCGPGRLGLIGRIIKGNIDENPPQPPFGKGGKSEQCLTGFAPGDCVTAARAPRTGRVRAFVSAMRGCNCGCTYCVVPFVRGPERSRPAGEILAEINELERAGVREVTILGQSIDRYGRDLEPRCDLADLLRSVGKESGLERIRFVTSSPRGITPKLLEAMAGVPSVCEALHMPAQSGSDGILKAMKRPYTSAQYIAVVAEAQKHMPAIELSSDFIVGFPGETDEDFEATLRLMEETRFLQCFIFKYSPREGTAAAALADDVPAGIKAERHARLLEAQNRITLEKHEALVGGKVEVLAEGPSRKDPSRFAGRTRQNHIVIFDPGRTKPGDLVVITIENCTALSLYGTPQPTRNY